MLVLGGPCNRGYTLRVFDITKNNFTVYYWDLSGNPSDSTRVCVGHDGGMSIVGISRIERDIFLSASGVYTSFVQFSLDPIGMKVISSPSVSVIFAFN